MNKLLLLLACIALSCGYGKAQISMHTAQIEAFHNLMRYVEEKAGGKLNCNPIDGVDLQVVLERNSNDSKLSALIDTLLNSSVFYSPEHIKNVTTWLSAEKVLSGREAYKAAFTVLPDFCVGITGGITHAWVAYWNHEHRERVDNAIIELMANQNEILENVKSTLKTLLPRDIDMNTETNIHIMVDGNRGPHVFGNNVMMDMVAILIFTGFSDFSNFINILKHELHHIYYGEWFAEKTGNKERNEGKNFLYTYQMMFIFEGIAQRIDFDDKSSEAKQMYANRELIAELFDEWISVMRGMKGDSPQVAFQMFQESFGDIAIERLKRFWPGDPDSMEIPNRPNVTYTLSYNLYNSIYEAGGHEKLKYIIENPEKLLLVFNELHTDSMIVSRIPDDVVKLWQDNF